MGACENGNGPRGAGNTGEGLTRSAAAARAVREEGAIVYYLRVADDRIKIGYTTNLKQRLSNLRLDRSAVLATEPGGRDVEFRRHHEFADERYGRREDFAASDELLAHIRRLAAQYRRRPGLTWQE